MYALACHTDQFCWILSVQSCTDTSSWHPGLELASLSRPAEDFAQSLQENAALLTVHTPLGNRLASLEGLGEVLGLPEFLARRSNIFYLQQVKLGFFLISNFCLQILLFQWLLPCNLRILEAGVKAFRGSVWGSCSPACLSLSSLLLSWSFSELPMGPHKVLNCRFKLPALILGELGSTKYFCPRRMQRRGCK